MGLWNWETVLRARFDSWKSPTFRFSDGAQNKSGRTDIYGDSFAIHQLRQRLSDYTPADCYYYYYEIISYYFKYYKLELPDHEAGCNMTPTEVANKVANYLKSLRE